MSKVMIVDDSSVMRKIIQRNIVQAGLLVDQFIEAGDGKEALEKVNQNKDLNLILCDWNMPNMTGIEFVRAFRSSDKNTPIVMITTEGGEAKADEAKNNGANGYLTKPFTTDQLLRKLGDYLLVK